MADQIQVGDPVRSYDFYGEDGCYREGVVEAIVTKPDCDHYKIRVTKTVWEGEEVAKPGMCDTGYVYPPVNGAQTTFGRTVDRVVKI